MPDGFHCTHGRPPASSARFASPARIGGNGLAGILRPDSLAKMAAMPQVPQFPGMPRMLHALIVLVALSVAGSPALAAEKHRKTHHGKKGREYCQPLDLSGGALPCYRLAPHAAHGRCEPQSLPYARCRTGIMRCQGNCETSPIAWFRCEEKLGKTSTTPPPGQSVLILGDNAGHGMRTGHVMVVEKALSIGKGQWELTLSHTNYDRRCSIETDVLATYDESNRLLAMNSGHWKMWGNNLKALGFIQK